MMSSKMAFEVVTPAARYIVVASSMDSAVNMMSKLLLSAAKADQVTSIQKLPGVVIIEEQRQPL